MRHATISSVIPALPSPRWSIWGWLKASLAILSFVLLAGTWSFTLARLQQEQDLVVEHTRAVQQNLALIISENLRQVLERGALYSLVAGRWFNAGPQPTEANLSAMLLGDRAYNRIRLFDLDGRELYASSPSRGQTALKAAIEDFIRAGQGGSGHAVRVGPRSDAYGETLQVPLLEPVKDAAGTTRGVIVLNLDLGYLLSLYQEIDIGNSGLIQIVGSDGAELARARRGGLEAIDPAKAISRLPAGAPPQGSLIAPLFADGKPYLVSYRGLDAYPFAVRIDQDMGQILAQFESRKQKYLASMTTLTVVALLLMTGAAVMLRRLHVYFEAVKRSEREKRALIEQLEGEKRRAYELAFHDHLTGLTNRRMFMELAASHLARARRSRQHYALLFLDLDRFKAINDSLGHKVGDLLLQTVSRRLKESLRESDVIARFGGDEFVILLTGLEKDTDVIAIADKLVETVCKPCTGLDGHDVQIGPSIGVALYPRDGQDIETLIRHADTAMYQSKKVSRGTFTFFDQALNVKSIHEFDLEQRLPRAIAEGEFVLCYQPKVELQGYRIVGFEALVRWRHPEHGLIFPGDFIPMAEGTGHIVALGNWVLEAACRQVAEWKRMGLPVVPVAINLSARQLREVALAERILGMVAQYGLSPADLQVEVTESSLVENIEVAGAILQELEKAGVRVALDDFGNGFSSLGYIKKLPIDIIKIDRVFVKDIVNSPDDAIIVESTIILAHNLGMQVVAEGVESRDQLIHLRTAGCDQVQGYFFSRPVFHEQAQEMLLDPVRLPL